MSNWKSTWNTMVTRLGFRRKERHSRSNRISNRKLRFEQCEDRRLLATFMVKNPGDFIDADPNVTTLREAIDEANLLDDADEIYFASSVSGMPIGEARGTRIFVDGSNVNYQGSYPLSHL